MLNRLSIKAFTVAIFLAASLNLGWQGYRMHRDSVERRQMFEQTGFIWCYLGPALDERARFFLELLLIVALIGSWSRGFKCRVVSFVCLAGAVVIYFSWWRYYFLLAEISESEVRFIPQFGYLLGGNYLDVIIAAWIACLILLHLRLAVLSIFRSLMRLTAGILT